MSKLILNRFLILCTLLLFSKSLFAFDSTLIDSLKNVISTEKDHEVLSGLYKQIGDLYFQVDRDSILQNYEQSLVHANLTDTHKDDINILKSYGYYYTNLMNDYEEALGYFDKAHLMSINHNDSINIAYVLNSKGIINWRKGEYEKSIEYHFEADRIAQITGDADARLRTLLSLGVISNEGLENEEAVQYYKTALPLAEEIGHVRGKGVLLNNLGIVFRDLEKIDSSQIYFNKALQLFDSLNDDNWRSLTYFNIGDNYLKQKKYKTAIDYFEKALSFNEILQNKDREVMIILGLAETYSASNQFQKAIKVSFEGKEILETFDTKRYHQSFNLILAKSYESIGNFERSNFYYKEKVSSPQSIDGSGQKEELEKVKAFFSNKEKQSKINSLELQHIEDIDTIKKGAYLFNLSILAFALTLALLGLFFYRMKLNQLRDANKLKNKLMNDLHDNIGSSLNQIRILANKVDRKTSTADTNNPISELSRIKMISNNMTSGTKFKFLHI